MSLYRIYRDTRFSEDKTPLKTHVAAHFPSRSFRGRGRGTLSRNRAAMGLGRGGVLHAVAGGSAGDSPSVARAPPQAAPLVTATTLRGPSAVLAVHTDTRTARVRDGSSSGEYLPHNSLSQL